MLIPSPINLRWYRCKFRRVDCRHRCGATLFAFQLESHEHDHCRHSNHPCVLGCGQEITKANMDVHVKKVTTFSGTRGMWFQEGVQEISSGAKTDAAYVEYGNSAR